MKREKKKKSGGGLSFPERQIFFSKTRPLFAARHFQAARRPLLYSSLVFFLSFFSFLFFSATHLELLHSGFSEDWINKPGRHWSAFTENLDPWFKRNYLLKSNDPFKRLSCLTVKWLLLYMLKNALGKWYKETIGIW